MELNDIKQIVELFSKSNVDRLEIDHDGFALRLGKKKEAVAAAPVEYVQTVPAVQAAPAPQEAPTAESQGLKEVTSPIVGTFYRAPNPNSEPFVSVGSKVKAGQTLCIVEAMKLMNEIQADYSCEIVEIVVENGEGVEFGQPLFKVKPL